MNVSASVANHLTPRQRRALKAFEGREVVHVHHLPTNIGTGTMAQLIALGLIEPTDRSKRPHAKGCGWRLVTTFAGE